MENALVMPWAIPVIFGCLVAIVAILANVTSSTIKSLSLTSLKKRMLKMGYTATDIERVVCASPNQCPHCGAAHPVDDPHLSKPPKPPKHPMGVA